MRLKGLPRSAVRFVVVLGAALLCTTVAQATDVSGNCPAGGFTAAGSPWNFTGGVSVPAATTCTVQAGATLNGNGNGLSVGGTLTAVGASTANRNVVFNNVVVSFQPNSMGTLQFCTAHASTLSYPILLYGTQTVSGCTIDLSNGSYGIYTASGSPTIGDNTITAPYGVYVQDGTPMISNNTITTSYTGILYAAGGGTASGNTIGFSGGSPGRFGISVAGSATPTLSGNTILDDAAVSDVAISAVVTAAGVQIVNNTVNVSGGDFALQIAPALFQAGSQVSGNNFPTGLAAGVALTGQVTALATVGPLTPAPSTTVTTYVVQSLNVPAAATLTIAAGVTLTGGTSAGYLSVAGTLTAVGASTANRNVVFDNVVVSFQPDSMGTLQFCTAHASTLSYPILLYGTQTVSGCTIDLSNGSYGIYTASGSPTIGDNTITAPYGVYVQDGTPMISNNTITTSYTGILYAAGGGTASGNTIGFSGGSPGRFGISVAGSATPTLSGNTILDDAAVSDVAISAVVTAAGVQIVNNTVNVSGGDFALQIAPALFQAGSQVSGNNFPTGLAAGVALTGQVTGLATVGPLTPAPSTTVTTYVVQSLNVPAAATLTIAAGVTLTGGTSAGYLSVAGTLTAVGASTANRNVVFDNVVVSFQPDRGCRGVRSRRVSRRG